MSQKIAVIAGENRIIIELNNTKTARAVAQAAPFTATANTWGDEIYFRIPVRLDLENGREVVERGDVGYWPPGSAMCLFFGPTPASRGNEIRPASAVSVFGKIIGDLGVLRQVKDGNRLQVTLVE